MERGDGGNIDDLPTLRHIGNGKLAHGYHRLTVQVGHVQVHVQRRIHHGTKLTEAAGVQQQSHLHRLCGQRLGIGGEAAAVRQIQRQRADGEGDGLSQGLQLRGAACDDPHLVERAVLLYGFGKAPAHAAGCAGDDSDLLHIYLRKSDLSRPL